jgi:2,3-bisphosphoglycerate-dependent phosphoglycerate mutase
MNLLLLRHAESRPDHALPEANWPLSDRGREQAQRLIDALTAQRPEHLFSSPYRRARDTIAPYAATSGLAVTTEPAFAECTFRTGYVADWPAPIARAWANRTYAGAGCKSADACQTRMLAGVEALVRRFAGRRLLICSHGNAIGLLLNAIDPAFGFAQWQAMTTPALYEVDLTARDLRAIPLPF